MQPDQIRIAFDGHWPVVVPMGVLKYHRKHLPVGVDGLIVLDCLVRLGLEPDFVMLPPFWYGAATHAGAGPERSETLRVDAEALVHMVTALVAALLRVALRSIHVQIHP